jgi:hypothetical protein
MVYAAFGYGDGIVLDDFECGEAVWSGVSGINRIGDDES